MSGVVFSAVIIVCLLIPGLVLQQAVLRGYSKWAAVEPLDFGSAKTFVLAVVLSLLFHTVWIALVNLLNGVLPFIGKINFEEILGLLVGEAPADSSSISKQLSSFLPVKFTIYVYSQIVAAEFFAKHYLKRLEATGKNIEIALSLPGYIWHKNLRYVDDNPLFIIISLSVQMTDKTYLYYGLLDHLEVNPDGSLAYVVLEGASRRELGNDERLTEAGEEIIQLPSYQIPGEKFIVNCSRVATVDIDYFYEETGAESTEIIEGREE